MSFIEKSKKVACFIHNANLDIWGTEILENLVNTMKNTNFFDLVEFVFINNVGKFLDESMFENISNKIIIKNYSTDTKQYEYCTLNLIHSFSKINLDYKILYLHSKGCTHPRNKSYISNLQDWVNFMLYCLVENASSCVELLENNDCVGCNLRYPQYGDNTSLYNGDPKHYSGNFWWAKSSYLASNPVENLRGYYEAEWYLFKQNPSYINIYTCQKGGHLENSFKKHEYENVVQNNLAYYKQHGNYIKSRVDFVKVGIRYNGISNQLNPIVNAIVDKIISKQNIKHAINDVIFLSNFSTDAISDSYCSIKDILDLEHINTCLKEYNITLIPEEDAEIEITKLEYGMIGENIIDVTDLLKPLCTKNKQILVNYDILLNTLCGDPLPNKKKVLYIKYKINNYEFEVDVEEFCNKVREIVNINLNVNNAIYNSKYENVLNKNVKEKKELTKKIFRTLKFNDSLKEKIVPFMDSIKTQYEHISILHLRNSHDAIDFWSGINRMYYDDFQKTLNNKYIHLIETYLNKEPNHVIVILCSNTENNAVIEYLTSNNYNIVFLDKNIYKERELNGALDMIICQLCNNLLICNYNPNILLGSTFSYVLSTLISDNCKIITMDLDHIDHPEYIL